MMKTDDADLQIKKRARRRLVGAVAFLAFAALVLPMVMDQEPVTPTQEVEIHIPGRNAPPFRPDLMAEAPPPEVATPPQAEIPPPSIPTAVPQEASPSVSVVRTVPGQQQEQAAAPKPEPSKPEAKPEKPQPAPESPAASTKASNDEARRAAAILAGNLPDAPRATSAASGQHVILIGAFSNEANVKNLKTKLGELSVPMYTEPLESPQGKKTRVRAGPFPNREAAEKALEKIKRIGVSGVVVAK